MRALRAKRQAPAACEMTWDRHSSSGQTTDLATSNQQPQQPPVYGVAAKPPQRQVVQVGRNG